VVGQVIVPGSVFVSELSRKQHKCFDVFADDSSPFFGTAMA
jgi:hypothetical protein